MSNYNAAFVKNSIEFMRRYSLVPDANFGKFGAISDTEFNPAENAADKTYLYRQIERGKGERRAYLNFVKVKPSFSKSVSGMTRNMSASGQIKVTGSYRRTSDDEVRSYYLPWQTETVIGINIPKINDDGVNRTPYFFTAGINGCSVFIKGDRKSPSVYHAGGDTQQADPNDGATFWRDILESHPATSTAAKGPTVGEVNKTQYVLDKVTYENIGLGRGTAPRIVKVSHGTAMSRDYQQWISSGNTGTFTIEKVSPEGCVMGIRADNGDWTFYLQENVSITYFALQKKTHGFLGTKTKTVEVEGSKRTIMRPMQLTEIFPGGPGHARFNHSRSTVLKFK
jgi:hypothetical protein